MKVAPVIVAIIVNLSVTGANARYVQSTKARYETSEGHSDWYTVARTLLTEGGQ